MLLTVSESSPVQRCDVVDPAALKFPFIRELPINSVFMPSPAWRIENSAWPGPARLVISIF